MQNLQSTDREPAESALRGAIAVDCEAHVSFRDGKKSASRSGSSFVGTPQKVLALGTERRQPDLPQDIGRERGRVNFALLPVRIISWLTF